MLRYPKLHADHRPIGDAAFKFSERRFDMLRIEINEAECAVGEFSYRPENLVVLLP